MALAFADIAFTPSVQQEQDRMGSGKTYARFLSDERTGGDQLGPDEADFISQRDGFFQATVSETGWPYVQFRGGPAGFLKVIDAQTIAFADLRGNRQYISLGNLAADDRVSLILVDYPNRRRLKIWGRARIVDTAENTDYAAIFEDIEGDARTEHVIAIHVEAIDWNCPRHIPVRLTMEEFEPYVAELRAQIEQLSNQNAALIAGAESTTDFA